MTRSLLVFLFAGIPFLTGLALWLASLTITHYTNPVVYDDLASVPVRRAGLVLGCTPLTRDGQRNAYFDHRMQAAADLFHAGKVEFLLLSGDNRDHSYDEPRYMRRALLERGVPEDRMQADRSGLRTLDSVVRAQRVFGLDRLTVVSQEFHNRRAVFIASHFGIDAIGYNARDVEASRGLRTRAREAFARVKTLLDLYVLGTEPAVEATPAETGRP